MRWVHLAARSLHCRPTVAVNYQDWKSVSTWCSFTLTSLVQITIGLLAVNGIILRGNPSMQHSVTAHLSAAAKGVLTLADLNRMVQATVDHSGRRRRAPREAFD